MMATVGLPNAAVSSTSAVWAPWQIQESPGVGLTGKNLLLAKKQQHNIRTSREFPGLSEAVSACVAAVSQRFCVADPLLAERIAKRCERGPHIVGPGIHHPRPHLIDRAVGKRTDHRKFSDRARDRQDVAFVLQQNHALWRSEAPGYVEAVRRDLGRLRTLGGIVEQADAKFEPKEYCGPIRQSLSWRHGADQ